MLCICGWFSEEDCSSSILHVLSRFRHRLSIRLHRELLEVGWESVHVLIERCNKMCLCTKEVGIPDAEETSNNWDVLVKRGCEEMFVHGVGACEELVEI